MFLFTGKLLQLRWDICFLSQQITNIDYISENGSCVLFIQVQNEGFLGLLREEESVTKGNNAVRETKEAPVQFCSFGDVKNVIM